MPTTLTIGKKYDVDNLSLIGWTDGDGSGSDGYRIEDYFDVNGEYLGPDCHGIEPIVE